MTILSGGASTAGLSQSPTFLLLRREAGGGQRKLVVNWTEEPRRILASGGVK